MAKLLLKMFVKPLKYSVVVRNKDIYQATSEHIGVVTSEYAGRSTCEDDGKANHLWWSFFAKIVNG